MSIVNRNVNSSGEREAFTWTSQAAVNTGATGTLVSMPYAGSLDFVAMTATGVSGSPTIQLNVTRFVVGAGSTVFSVGPATPLVNFGTSGPVFLVGTSTIAYGASIPALGSTLTTLQPGDYISFIMAGANSAVTSLVITPVLRPIADYVKYYNTL
jgi:hypothetical protein